MCLSITDNPCLLLSFQLPKLSARGRTFARNNSFGRGKQSHLGLVVLGPLLPRGNLGGHLVFQCFPILGFVFCFMRNHPTNERTNRRTNERGCSVSFWCRHGSIPWFCVSSPALSCTKRGDSKSSLVFNKLKTHSSDCEGCHFVFLSCTTVAQPPFCVRRCVQTIAHNIKQGGNASGRLSRCIRVRRPGFSWRDI